MQKRHNENIKNEPNEGCKPAVTPKDKDNYKNKISSLISEMNKIQTKKSLPFLLIEYMAYKNYESLEYKYIIKHFIAKHLFEPNSLINSSTLKSFDSEEELIESIKKNYKK